MRCSYRFIFFVFLLTASSCAIQVAPTGGEKDTSSPEIKKSVPENFSTNFSGHDISITFDEYIALKDLNSQFIVSPPLKYQPDPKVKKKTLVIHLDDTLLQNTTYTMNFGNAITDMREGNAVSNFQYVFSTGDILDSLKVSGKVENASNLKTEKGILVMMYRGTDDSLPLKTLPDYIARTNEDGLFEIKNVSPGSYKIFALKDNNSNNLFDDPEEGMAFQNDRIQAGDTGIRMAFFKETKKQQLLKATSDEPGRITIAWTRPLGNVAPVFISDTSAMKIHAIIFSQKRDTMTLWYRSLQSDSLNMVVRSDETADTISLRLKKPETKTKSRSAPVLTVQYTLKTENDLDLNEHLQFIFNHPVDSFGFSGISVLKDSVPMKDVHFYFSDSLRKNLVVDFPVAEKSGYAINIPPGAFKDIFGLRNDTLQLLFRSKSVSDYGTVAVQVKLSDSGKNYLLQLIDEKENVFRQSVINSDTTLNYDYLSPRTYRLKMIEDNNNNHEWDTGNYMQKRQPERVFYYRENLTVRANWDVEVTWDMPASRN